MEMSSWATSWKNSLCTEKLFFTSPVKSDWRRIVARELRLSSVCELIFRKKRLNNFLKKKSKSHNNYHFFVIINPPAVKWNGSSSLINSAMCFLIYFSWSTGIPVWLNRNSKCCIIGFDHRSYHVCSTCHMQCSMLRLVSHKSSNEIFPSTNCMFDLKNAFNVASWSSTKIDEGTFQHMQWLLWTQKILSFQMKWRQALK